MLLIRKLQSRNVQRGLTLVELMVAMTLSLLIIAGLSAVFVGNSRSRAEIERSNQQIENGRYALQVLTDDIQMAGYLAELDVTAASLASPTVEPDPCATSVTALNSALPVHIQAYDNSDGALTCLGATSSPKANTDIIVIRRASGCVAGTTDCDLVAGAPYFQASLCNSSSELSSLNDTDRFRLDTSLTNLDRHKRDCATLADKHQFLTRIYFIDDHDQVGDGIPTLKRAELTGTGFVTVPISEGIENLQLEYGIDTNNDGAAEAYSASPDTYNGCAGTACITNLLNIVSVKVHLLARNTTPSVGYKDSKTYNLGTMADGTTPNDVPAANDAYRRHVYSSVVKVVNAAGRRES